MGWSGCGGGSLSGGVGGWVWCLWGPLSALLAPARLPPHAPCVCVQLYLPRGSLEATDITTAKSSEVNVIVPGATGQCGAACL